MEKIQ
jgi:phospholipase D1/2